MPIQLKITYMLHIILISIATPILLNPRLLKSIIIISRLLKSSMILLGINDLMLNLMTWLNTMHTMRLF